MPVIQYLYNGSSYALNVFRTAQQFISPVSKSVNREACAQANYPHSSYPLSNINTRTSYPQDRQTAFVRLLHPSQAPYPTKLSSLIELQPGPPHPQITSISIFPNHHAFLNRHQALRMASVSRCQHVFSLISEDQQRSQHLQVHAR